MRSVARTLLLAALCAGQSQHPVSAEEPAPADRAPPAVDGEAEAVTPAQAEKGGKVAQLDALEAELAEVMDELVSARARAGVMARALFRTALTVAVLRRADDQAIGQLTLRLDGAPVHDGDGSALTRDRAQLFEGHVAPGIHELTIEVKERARANGAFGYARSERYRIDVKEGRRTQVELILRDDSDMAEQLAEGDDGTYSVETELRVHYARGED